MDSTTKTQMEATYSCSKPCIGDNQTGDQQLEEDGPQLRIWWSFTIFLLIHHLLALHTGVLVVQGNFLWSTLVYAIIIGTMTGASVTVGAHRLFAHRCYKAKWELRLLLVILQVMTFQSSMWQWVAWHRAHHKHSEKELDPHNASRGFFYAHVGWLLTYDPKRFRKQLETIDMEDVEADPIVMWQERNYDVLFLALYIVTVAIPCICFGENPWTAFTMVGSARLLIVLHITWLVNSAAHLYGYKPYDKSIYPCENALVSFLSLGEGWHNYHHTFPWDYRASEYGGFYRINPSTMLINLFAKIGWAYDLKTASGNLVTRRMIRTGMPRTFSS